MEPHDGGVYDAELAHARARERAERTRTSRLAGDVELRQVIQAKLELEWSPEQIAAWGRGAYPKRTEWHVCHETIYQALYHGGRGGLSRQLTTPGCARGGRCASDADHPTSAHPGSWCPPH